MHAPERSPRDWRGIQLWAAANLDSQDSVEGMAVAAGRAVRRCHA